MEHPVSVSAAPQTIPGSIFFPAPPRSLRTIKKRFFTTSFVLIPARLTKDKIYNLLQNENITNKTFKSDCTMLGFVETVSHREPLFDETGKTDIRKTKILAMYWDNL